MYQTEHCQNKQNMPAVDGDVVSFYFLNLDTFWLYEKFTRSLAIWRYRRTYDPRLRHVISFWQIALSSTYDLFLSFTFMSLVRQTNLIDT